MKSVTAQTLARLRAYESRNVTFMEPDGSWPIVWDRARGVEVWDADGRRYLDLTAAFGVAAAGHANPRVVQAGQRQMSHLLHAMGDVHPHPLKGELVRELSRLTFERWGAGPGKTILGNSGFEAVEAALKTACLATGKPGVIAFHGAYHGLGYGALNATHRSLFRAPFASQLRQFGHFVPYPGQPSDMPGLLRAIRHCLRAKPIGAILVEPVQGRGGIRVPPPEFLPELRELCDQAKILLVADEVFTGFGRTGKWFACEHAQVVPDLICLGKAMTGGFPLSACVGRASVMDAAWPVSQGEAIHTSTFLGHPVGCAMALAQIREIRRLKLVERSRKLGRELRHHLEQLPAPSSGLKLAVRGQGLMAGLELTHPDGTPATRAALQTMKTMLQRGYILLPEGEHANTLAFTPPLTITSQQLFQTVRTLGTFLQSAIP